MHRDLKHVPAVEPAAAGIALALGECEMLCWLDVKTTKSNNIGLMAEAVGDAHAGDCGRSCRESPIVGTRCQCDAVKSAKSFNIGLMGWDIAEIRTEKVAPQVQK
jgi:hypothetical protein